MPLYTVLCVGACACPLARLQIVLLWTQDSLSGDSKTLMFVNVNPTETDAAETACSLQFAARVRGVEMGPAKRHIEAGGEIQQLRDQLQALQMQVGWAVLTCLTTVYCPEFSMCMEASPDGAFCKVDSFHTLNHEKDGFPGRRSCSCMC